MQRTSLYPLALIIFLGAYNVGILGAQVTGFCCDPDCISGGCDNDFSGPAFCGGESFDSDGFVCDPDCNSSETADVECTTIPLDGGLSLLALAGGGLATAAMRRRREEEEAAQHVA